MPYSVTDFTDEAKLIAWLNHDGNPPTVRVTTAASRLKWGHHGASSHYRRGGVAGGGGKTERTTPMIRIFFLTIDLAVSHARDHGVWIAECCDGTVQWFDAAHFTLTPIIEEISKYGGGKIGVWPHFDPAHPMHALIESQKRRPEERPLCHSA